LLTNEQLKEEIKKANEKAQSLLQMPPWLSARKRIDTVLNEDKRLDPLNLKKSNYMFIDISLNLPNHVKTFDKTSPSKLHYIIIC
jgi:hypothetical protein